MAATPPRWLLLLLDTSPPGALSTSLEGDFCLCSALNEFIGKALSNVRPGEALPWTPGTVYSTLLNNNSSRENYAQSIVCPLIQRPPGSISAVYRTYFLGARAVVAVGSCAAVLLRWGHDDFQVLGKSRCFKSVISTFLSSTDALIFT